MSKDTAEYRVSRARIRLLLEQPFFGSLMLYLEPVELKPEQMRVPTMGVDGKHLFYCSDFVMNLPPEQLVAVMAHEIGHIALDHLGRQQSREEQRWNWAADFADNDLIANTTDSKGQKMFQLPPDCLLNPRWHDLTAEEIYTKLPRGKGGGGGGAGSGNQGQNSSGGSGSSGNQGQGQNSGGGGLNGISGVKGSGQVDDHSVWKDWTKTESNEQARQTWKGRIARAAVEARTRGKMPGGWDTVIEDFLEPKMDWKSILTDTIVSLSKNDFRLFPPNKKHIWRGIYLPSMRGEEINIMFGADVSGSISDEEIHEALSEVKGICDQFSDYTIYLRAFDTKIHNRWELHPFEPIPMVVTGRGGTDFGEICDEVDKVPPISTLVIFTDLEAPFPPEVKSVPVIWLSVTEKKAPWGLTIHYPRKG